MKAFLKARTAVAVIMSCLAGCGGGGSDGGDSQPGISLQAAPLAISAGDSTTLTWSVTSANSCTASGGWSGSRATSGSETITNVQTTTSFTLTCSNGSRQQSQSVNVTVALPAPPVITITSTPALAERGHPITINWSVTGATSCRSEWFPADFNRPAQGSAVYDVTANFSGVQIYLPMTCDGPGGSTSQTLLVPVRTFAGELRAPPGLWVDTDVNDVNAPAGSNDTYPNSVPSFALIPGYVNVAGQGPPGRSFASGDQWDYFVVDGATAGQVAHLILPTYDASKPASERDDADLYLYDWISNTLIDASIGDGPEEMLVYPRTGQFVVAVKAEHGGFNYLLSLEDAPLVASTSSQRLSSEFVPGEAIVSFAADSPASKPRNIQGKSSVGSSGLRTKAGGPGRPMLMEFSTATPSASAAIQQKQKQQSISQKAEAQLTAEMRSKLATLLEVKRLSRLDGVRSASVNRIVHAQAAPTDPDYPRQRWNYESISLPAAWDITTGSSNVIVAVIDSGAVADHPDLQGKFVDGYDMIDMDADFTDPGYAPEGRRIYHGTHVMGTVGAVANNGIGGSGVAWGSRIMPIRALDGRNGNTYKVMQAVRYAAGMPNDSGRVPSKPADIINLSLGSADPCTTEEAEVFSEVAARGITVVAAAGNERSNGQYAPATCPGVFGVAATGPGGNLAPYSNFGPTAVIAAPGGDMRYDADRDGFLDGIFSTSGDFQNGVTVPSYAALEGTSMAAPHVSGVFALMKSIKPTLSPVEFRQLLEGGWLTDQDPGTPSPNELGYGIINAYKAVRAAGDNFTPPARVGSSPGLLNLSRISPTATFQLRNTGIGALSITSVQGADSWLSITPVSVDANGLGTYRASVDNSTMPHGTLHTAVAIQSTAGPSQVPVAYTNLPYNIESSLSALHLRVIDASTGAVVRTNTYTRYNSHVSYRFDDLPAGNYIVIAGTDNNNDGNLCDPGEVCGTYPVRSLPEPIEYTGLKQAVDIDLNVTALEQK